MLIPTLKPHADSSMNVDGSHYKPEPGNRMAKAGRTVERGLLGDGFPAQCGSEFGHSQIGQLI